MEFNLADLFEAAVDAYPEREYLVADGKRRTYAEMEARANQLAHHLAANGIGPGDHVGIYAYNSVEWVETAWAVFKLRAIWININYRYVKDELRYLMGNADLKALVYQREFSPLVGALLSELPELRHLVVIEDGSNVEPAAGSVPYEDALAGQSTARDFGPRSGDDLYILYTGGTTGMPKGVVWRHEDVFYALGGGIDPMSNTRVTDPATMAPKGAGGGMVHLPVAPLMHGATQWCVMGQSFVGSKIVLMAKFDPREVWQLVGAEKVNSVMITGDAMGKPLVETLAEARDDFDVSTLVAVVSSAALFSSPVKDQFFEQLPNLFITDAVGSSEGGNNGLTVVTADNTAMKSGPTVHLLGKTVVFDENLDPVEPGSGVIGKIARAGDIPQGYYNDPKKTAEVFIEVRGHPLRHARATTPPSKPTGPSPCWVAAPSSSTPAARRSSPRRSSPPSARTPTSSTPSSAAPPTSAGARRWLPSLSRGSGMRRRRSSDSGACREFVAGYKVPRRLHVVDKVERSPSGKPDYTWAADIVNAGADAESGPGTKA